MKSNDQDLQHVLAGNSHLFFEKQVLTVEEAADLLKLSKRTIYKKVASHAIPFKRIGANIRFYFPDLIRWLRKE